MCGSARQQSRPGAAGGGAAADGRRATAATETYQLQLRAPARRRWRAGGREGGRARWRGGRQLTHLSHGSADFSCALCVASQNAKRMTATARCDGEGAQLGLSCLNRVQNTQCCLANTWSGKLQAVRGEVGSVGRAQSSPAEALLEPYRRGKIKNAPPPMVVLPLI